MLNTITKVNDEDAKRILKSLENNIQWTPKKRKQAKDFLSALKQAKLAEEGKIKLKTVQSLIDEL